MRLGQSQQVEEVLRISVLVLLFAAAVIVQSGCEEPVEVAASEKKVGSSEGEGSEGEGSGGESGSNEGTEGTGTCSGSVCTGPDSGLGRYGLGLSSSGSLGLSALGEGGWGEGTDGEGGCGGGSSGSDILGSGASGQGAWSEGVWSPGAFGQGSSGLGILGPGTCGQGADGEGGCGQGAWSEGAWSAGTFGLGRCGEGNLGPPAGGGSNVEIKVNFIKRDTEDALPRATVKAAEGDAQRMVLVNGIPNWVPLEVGQQIRELTVLRTGMRSMVRIDMGAGLEVTVQNATKIGIANFPDVDKLVDLTLKYGTVNLDRGNVTTGPQIKQINVNTPAGAVSFIGRTGSVSFGGSSGLRLAGKNAWRADPNGAATGIPSAYTPGEHLRTMATILAADIARNRAMARALGNARQPTTPIVHTTNTKSAAIRVTQPIPVAGGGNTVNRVAPTGRGTGSNPTGGPDPIVNSVR